MNPDPDFQPENVRELFNRMSGSYERMNYITSFGFSLRWRRQFIQALPPSQEKLQVLDLLTGMGEIWSPLKKHYPHCELSALDFSEGMLKPARKRNDENFNGKVKILQQDLLNNSLEENYYDVVYCAFGLKTFNEQQIEILAREVKRILKPGGRYSFIEVSAPKKLLLYSLYKLHLKHVVPFCGWLFLGNPTEYRMLWKYTDKFQDSSAAKEIFMHAGLSVEATEYFYGCATGFKGHKA